LALRVLSDTVPKSGVKPKKCLGADDAALAGVTDGVPGTVPDQAPARAAAKQRHRRQTYGLRFGDRTYVIAVSGRVEPWCIFSSIAYGVS
jgi:hypothetical protein